MNAADGIAYSGTAPTVRVDSGKGQDCTLRGMTPVECAIDGWY